MTNPPVVLLDSKAWPPFFAPPAVLADTGPASWRSAMAERGVAQLARAPVSKTGGWGFETLHPCHFSGRPACLTVRGGLFFDHEAFVDGVE